MSESSNLPRTLLPLDMLTLVHLDKHTALVVGVSEEDLRLLVQDSRVAPDKGGHLPIDNLDTDGERGNVEQEVSDVSPLRMAAWTAAPKATASSELIDLFRSVGTEEVTDELLDARM